MVTSHNFKVKKLYRFIIELLYINGLQFNDEKYYDHYYKAFEEIIKDLT